MEFIRLTKKQDLDTYQPSEGLKAAAEMAQSLGRPLLLSGKPGTGKTQFAYWLAKSLDKEYNETPFIFSTKSNSVFTDLFYHYDAVSHFRSKDGTKSTADYIELTALGKAIFCAGGSDLITDDIKPIVERAFPKPIKRKSIVLIDEVDKAPRDFPNDLLHEIENMSFEIKELPKVKIKIDDALKQNVIVILTSNFEKNLPDAFLRRCVFYHIEFPNEEQLSKILINKLNLTDKDRSDLQNKVEFFFTIYNTSGLQKQPSTSECIDWVNWLKSKNKLKEPLHKVTDSLPILLKNESDLRMISSTISDK